MITSSDGKISIGWTLSGSGRLSIYVNGKAHSVDKEHMNYDRIKECLLAKDYSDLEQLLNIPRHIEVQIQSVANAGAVEVTDNEVKYDGRVIHSTIAKRILDLAKNGLPFDGMVKFLANLYSNPSSRAVNEAYDFLENRNLPITEDGCFLALKCVRSNWYDKHSGTVLNTIGSVISMPRNQVDDDRERECSYGYHVGAQEYSGPGGSFYNSGDQVVVVKVNPADIVAVPKDYNAQKMRVCKYEVLRLFDEDLDQHLYTANGHAWKDSQADEVVDEEETVEDSELENEDTGHGDYDDGCGGPSGWDDEDEDEEESDSWDSWN